MVENKLLLYVDSLAVMAKKVDIFALSISFSQILKYLDEIWDPYMYLEAVTSSVLKKENPRSSLL